MKRTKNMVYRPTTDSRELELYVVNCGKMYETIIVPTIESLKKKVKRVFLTKKKPLTVFTEWQQLEVITITKILDISFQ